MPANSLPRPKWRFRIFQFSIRTLFLVTAAVAVFCNWYFQPQRKDEELAGGMLKLRRQVKVEMREQSGVTAQPTSGTGKAKAVKIPVYINHGTWSLRDKEDNLLASGQYANDVPIGWWTIWHISGKKAAEGRMKNGAKSGVWTTWYEEGGRQSEVTYAATAPAAKSVGGSGYVRHSKFPLELSAYPREGVAKAWYPSGQLQFVGSYKDDKEEGPWQLFDEEGKLTSSGPYERGQRHGVWKLVDTAGNETTTEFIHGRKAGELHAQLALITKNLQSENPGDRLRGAYDLAELGEDGLPTLISALSHEGLETRIAAVRSLLRQGEAAAPSLPKLKELAAAQADTPLKFQALLAVYVIDPGSRGAMYDDLLAQAVELADPGATSDAFARIFACDEERQKSVLRKMLAWEAENASRNGQTQTLFACQKADVIGLLDDLYNPTLHGDSRKTLVAILSSLTRLRHPRFTSLIEKIKAENDPALKEAGEAIEARAKADEANRGGGFF